MLILIAEDEPLSRNMLTAMLADHGVVTTVENGMEAVLAFEQALNDNTPYDLVCLDVLMPEMDGNDALRRMRQAEKEAGIPPEKESLVIMTTAIRDKSIINDTFMRNRAAAYMVKPVRRANLLTVLRDFKLIKD